MGRFTPTVTDRFYMALETVLDQYRRDGVSEEQIRAVLGHAIVASRQLEGDTDTDQPAPSLTHRRTPGSRGGIFAMGRKNTTLRRESIQAAGCLQRCARCGSSGSEALIFDSWDIAKSHRIEHVAVGVLDLNTMAAHQSRFVFDGLGDGEQDASPSVLPRCLKVAQFPPSVSGTSTSFRRWK